jgi:hypothetical protein
MIHALVVALWPTTQRRRAVLIGALALAGCASPAVWVKPGATEADFEVAKGRCLAGAYSQVPAAPSVTTFGSGYQAPSFTNCSAMGNFANCTTTGGQYTPPAIVFYDANAGVRTQVFKGCMYGEGWSLEKPQTNAAVGTDTSGASDWILGYQWGVGHRDDVTCENAPPALQVGCRAAQNEVRAH